MKRTELKALIKEIVVRTMAEMEQQPQAPNPEPYLDVDSWELDSQSNDGVIFKGVLLPDKRMVDISVQMTGNWSDGAFNHAFGTKRYPLQFEPDKTNVVFASETETGHEVPVDAMIAAAGDALFDHYADQIIQAMPEPPSGPDPDDQRDAEWDRNHGR